MSYQGNFPPERKMPFRTVKRPELLVWTLALAVLLFAVAVSVRMSVRSHEISSETIGDASRESASTAAEGSGHREKRAQRNESLRQPPSRISHGQEAVETPTSNEEESASALGGGEVPFAVAFESVETPVPVMQLPDDAAGLCAALCAATTNGQGYEMIAIRNRLLEMGADAVSEVAAMLNCGIESVEIDAIRLLSQIGDSAGLVFAFDKVFAVPCDSPHYELFLAAFADNNCPAVAQWLVDMLGETQDSEARERMLDVLYTMRGAAVVAALERAALCPNDDLHAQDIFAVLATRQFSSETGTLAALLASEDTVVGEAAAYGLATIGNIEACRVLADAADAMPVCADALAVVSPARAQEALLGLATDSARSETVRIAALVALSGQSSHRIRTVLTNAAKQERSTLVADEMLMTLQTINNKQANAQNTNPLTGCDNGELWF